MKIIALPLSGVSILLLTMAFTPAPASAQVDLRGNWHVLEHQDFQQSGPGPDVVDYLGLPLNSEGRAKALAYSASILSLPERQCILYTPVYRLLGPISFVMSAEFDPLTSQLIAWRLGVGGDVGGLTIWMDGRPHPSQYAPHTFSGFTTGKWEGETLTTYTTHIKAGYLRRNGAPTSDQATIRQHFMRHGNTLTISARVEDPIYLTEPDVISRTWQLASVENIAAPTFVAPCMPEVEVPRLEGSGIVPHLLPGKNPFIGEVVDNYHIPAEAVLGGAETMYPEYRKKLKAGYVAPDHCVRYCCGWQGGSGSNQLGTDGGNAPGLDCITAGKNLNYKPQSASGEGSVVK